MIQKLGLLTGLGVLLALLALWVIQPRTRPGQVVLIFIVVTLANGVRLDRLFRLVDGDFSFRLNGRVVTGGQAPSAEPPTATNPIAT